MKTIMRILIVIIMMIKVVPAFSQSGGIWSNEGLPTGFGTHNADAFGDDGINDLAVGEEKAPIPDGLGMVMVASLLYGIYLVRKQNRKNASL